MQGNLIRTLFEARVTCTSPINDDRQAVDFTGYFEFGDIVDVVDVDANGNILSVLADNLTISAIDDNVAVVLSSAVDTTGAVGTPMIQVQQIDDGQSAMDRLYRRVLKGNVKFTRKETIITSAMNTPSAGKTTFYVANVRSFRAGDTVDVLADEGIVSSAQVIESVNPNADAVNNRSTVVINALIDTSSATNPFLEATSITLQQMVERTESRIDEIDRPVEGEQLAAANGSHLAFMSQLLFVQNSSKVLIDGVRKRRGTAGTRASLTQGAGNAQLILTSMILGLLGNETDIQVQTGAGLTVLITGSSSAGYLVKVNNNGGLATAADIAGAINSDSTAQRIVQAKYGGNGSGVVATFGPSALTGGLDDGTGDYAELEQVYLNNIASTGYKWVSFHIKTNERNRMNKAPQQDEELDIDYRKATDNVDM